MFYQAFYSSGFAIIFLLYLSDHLLQCVSGSMAGSGHYREVGVEGRHRELLSWDLLSPGTLMPPCKANASIPMSAYSLLPAEVLLLAQLLQVS